MELKKVISEKSVSSSLLLNWEKTGAAAQTCNEVSSPYPWYKGRLVTHLGYYKSPTQEEGMKGSTS